MWCPSCGTEYREGFETCNDCGCKLTEEQSDPVTVKGYDINSLAYLCSCSNDFEAQVTISLLDSCGIVGIKRYGSFSQVASLYCGSTNLGVDVYVSAGDLETAKEIMTAQMVYEDSEIDSGNGENNEEN